MLGNPGKKVDMDSIWIRRMTEDDYDKVMAIRKPQDLYHGWDYLPDYFLTLLNTPEITGYCACDDNKVICSVLAHRVDGGKTMVLRGARVSIDYAGVGVFRMLQNYVQDEHASYFGTEYKAITFNNEGKDMIKQVNLGKYNFIMNRNIITYRGNKEDTLYTEIPAEQDQITNTKILDKNDLETIFENDAICKELFPHDRLVVDWVPFRPKKSNVSQILTDRCRCVGSYVTDSCGAVVTDLSAFIDCGPIISFGNFANCANGLLYRMDIYGNNFDNVDKHIAFHTKRIADLKHNDIVFEIFCFKGTDIEKFDDVLDKFGYRRLQFYETKQYCAEKPIIT